MLLFDQHFPDHIIACTSDQSCDFALCDEKGDLSEDQKVFLSRQLKIDIPKPLCVHQVHGSAIICADQEYLSRERGIPEADGLLTDVSNVPLGIRTADCLPVFLWDTRNNCIGIVHAGWRGTLENIILKALGLMAGRWKSSLEDIKVVLGPSIRSCCYEVGEKFQEYFPKQVTSWQGRYYFDLAGENYNQLIDFGVKKINIFDCQVCTCCDRNYFSHRRDQTSKRMISLMMLR